MEKTLLPYQHLKIQLEEIISATNNFNDEKNRIGGGGFGKVYKGEVYLTNKGRSMVAIKRLDPKHGQGKTEFLKEITMLSDYTHENLISLLGFCDEGREMILVYELASYGSLDRHLNSSKLTWTQRLKICLDASKGLSYLHDPRETHQRLIHCDMKSGNILLDDQWNAKVADFGLSLMAPANERHSMIVTLAVGTRGYCDPQYAMTNTLTKESDVYSFGVVLFEVLCGRLCITYTSNGEVDKRFVPMWIESYKNKNLNDIIFKTPSIPSLDQRALEIFSDIAYRCLKESREDRPKMAEVVEELKTALERQELSEQKMLFDYEEMAKSAEPPLNYSSKDELRKLLSKGVLLNSGKTIVYVNLRVTMDGRQSSIQGDFSSLFLLRELGITYMVNLVCKFISPKEVRKCHYISLNHKLLGETETSISQLAYEREDGWWTCELYQFTSDHRIVDLEILFDGFHDSSICIAAEGIEFLPLEKVEHTYEKHPIISDPDEHWEEKMPTDYEEIMMCSIDSVKWTTKKEAYSIICKGILIIGEMWVTLDKYGKKCYMISAVENTIFCQEKRRLSLPESRFGEALRCDFLSLVIYINPEVELLSPLTTYATYLVYKLPEDQSGFEVRMKVDVNVLSGNLSSYKGRYVHLVSPQPPVIRPKADQKTNNPVNRWNIKGLPQQRNDGWMEVQILKFQTLNMTEVIRFNLVMSRCDDDKELKRGLIIEGFEFRPI